MVDFYVNMILDGDMTIDEVPKLWREKVRDKLSELKQNESEENL